jgi:hypothetical protein
MYYRAVKARAADFHELLFKFDLSSPLHGGGGVAQFALYVAIVVDPGERGFLRQLSSGPMVP